MIKLPPSVENLVSNLSKINQENQKIYLVGGIVRDLVLGRENKDIDILVEHDPRIIARRWADRNNGAFYVMDEARQTCRVICIQDKNRLVYDFARQQGNNLQDDLFARDFTINAMAISLNDPGILLDPLGGELDLRKKKLRECSETSFQSDPVRTIRAVRYANQYDLEIEPLTLQNLQQAVPLLSTVSIERKRDELLKILDGRRVLTALQQLTDFTIFPQIGIPSPDNENLKFAAEWADLVSTEGKNCHALKITQIESYFERYCASIRTKNSADRSFAQLEVICALLWGSSIKKIEKIGQNLLLSREEFERLQFILTHIDHLVGILNQENLPTNREIYRFFKGVDIAGVDIAWMSYVWYDLIGAPNREKLLRIVKLIITTWYDHPKMVHPEPFFNGKELMLNFDLTPGPFVGMLLEGLKEEQAAGTICSREQASAWIEDQVNRKFNERHWER